MLPELGEGGRWGDGHGSWSTRHVQSPGAAAVRGLVKTKLCGSGQLGRAAVRGDGLHVNGSPLPAPPPLLSTSSPSPETVPGMGFMVLVWNQPHCHLLRQAHLNPSGQGTVHEAQSLRTMPRVRIDNDPRCLPSAGALRRAALGRASSPGDCSNSAQTETEA